MKRTSFFAIALALTALTASAQYTLPALPYANNALEPHIDAQTMEIHHDRHHKAYVDNLNKAVAGKPEASMNIDQLVKKIDANTPAAIRNNGGGHWNHAFFWNILGKGGGTPSGPLAQAINASFGSLDKMKEEFAKAATGRFGSGWAWVIVGKDGKLAITSTPNQDNPLMPVAETQGTPILGLDVWEHAYYLKYQNKRPDYITAFWNVVNWDNVSKMYAAAKP
jgi:Fe-Mn family superoxide dismutase